MSTELSNPEAQLGSYRLLREIGRGAMGVVYEAVSVHPAGHLPADQRVALKLLVFPPLLPPEEREALIVRFAREARALAAVRHPFVVQVFDIGELEGQPYMVMEYLEGLNAREWLLRHGPMPVDAVTAVGQQLCEALDAVHAAGIVHRDIKPDNVVLEAGGTVRLTDFGIARMEVEASLTRTGGLIGSPAYMAPEQILGGAVDARSDLFSAGVMLYQLLTGELPFQGASIMEVAHRVAYDPPRPLTGIEPALAGVLLRAMEKEPARRYGTATDLRDALARASDPGSAAEGTRPIRGNPQPSDPDDQASYPVPAGPGDWRPASSVFTAPKAACVRHPQRRAVAGCAECDRPLCGQCVQSRRGRLWCSEHAAPGSRPAWVTRLEIVAIGLLFALLLWSLYPLKW